MVSLCNRVISFVLIFLVVFFGMLIRNSGGVSWLLLLFSCCVLGLFVSSSGKML